MHAQTICGTLLGTVLCIAGPSRADVAVLPFVAATPDSIWISAAVQHDLLSTLPHATAATRASGEDAPELARVAHSIHAAYVITGQVQRIDDQLRIAAVVHDADGRPLAAAKEAGEVKQLFNLEDKLAFDLRDDMRMAEQSHRHAEPMPVMQTAGRLTMTPQPAMPVGTVPVTYDSRYLREGKTRNIFNTPFYEYGGFGGFGFGGCGLGLGGFGFGSANVGFATGGTGQGAY